MSLPSYLILSGLVFFFATAAYASQPTPPAPAPPQPPPPPPAFDLSRLTATATSPRPRLYLTPSRLAALRQSIRTTHAAHWADVRAAADRHLLASPPAYIGVPDSSGYEQEWQRPVANALPTLAIAWLLSEDPKYLAAVKTWALASCAYPTWGLNYAENLDLAAGHQLFALALVYDWCHADLDEPTRRTIRDTLHTRGHAMYTGVIADKIFWRRTYLQNHLWVNAAGLTAAALALADDPALAPDAAKWLGYTTYSFQRTMESFGPDGASHEGLPYWEYGVEYLLKYMHLARDLLDIDHFQNEWFKNTATYAFHLSLPRAAWTPTNSVVDLGDSPRFHWYGPDYLLRALAAEYRDPHAQWYADQITGAKIAKSISPWLNLLWFDPTVPTKPPTSLPTLHHFTDMGIVAARTDWSGREALLVFKCGPFIGHKALEEYSAPGNTYDPGGSHVHPDANHFSLFALGQWLVCDDGYRRKNTFSQNTLLINGQGQFGEGKMWFDGDPALAAKSRPQITRATSTPALDHLTGDAAQAYPKSLGLKRFHRHLLFLKPSTLIVVDEVQTETPADLELRFHPETIPPPTTRRAPTTLPTSTPKPNPTTATTRPTSAPHTPPTSTPIPDNVYLQKIGEVNLRVQVLTPANAAFSFDLVPTPTRSATVLQDRPTLRLSTRAANWRTATAFTWSLGTPQTVILTPTQTGSSDTWTFSAGDQSAVFDWRDTVPLAPSSR